MRNDTFWFINILTVKIKTKKKKYDSTKLLYFNKHILNQNIIFQSTMHELNTDKQDLVNKRTHKVYSDTNLST